MFWGRSLDLLRLICAAYVLFSLTRLLVPMLEVVRECCLFYVPFSVGSEPKCQPPTFLAQPCTFVSFIQNRRKRGQKEEQPTSPVKRKRETSEDNNNKAPSEEHRYIDIPMCAAISAIIEVTPPSIHLLVGISFSGL